MRKLVSRFTVAKICIIFIFLLTVVSKSHVALAYTDGDYEYTVYNNEATITGYKGTGGDISIPSLISEYSVTSIGWGAFDKNDSLTSVTIPSGVTNINANSFRDCTSLSSVIIPETTTEIGAGAFNNCISLKSISITGNVKSIEPYTFANCINLTSVTLPKSLKTIDYQAFENCRSLTSITIPNGVTLIERYAFYNCKSLESVVIPDSVVYIDYGTFYGCINLKYAKFLGNAPSLGDIVFDNCFSDFKVYYNYGKTGFTNPWNGYKSVPLYSLTYNNNGSSGGKTPIDINTYLEGSQGKVKGNTGTLIKSGFTFMGWNTKADGSGINYQAGDKIVIGSKNITLYAKWRVSKPTVSFNSNGGSIVTSQSINYNGKAIKPIDPTKTGYIFGGWFKENTYINEFDFINTPLTNNITLHAKWIAKKYTVTFNSNGGSAVTSLKVDYDGKVIKPSTPTRIGYKFVGWYKEKTYVNLFNFTDDIVKGNITLYAKWIIVGTPSSSAVKSSSYNSINTTWRAVIGASGYEVWRSESSNGNYIYVTNTVSTTFTNKGLTTGRMYYYKVRAYKMVGKIKVYGDYSTVVSAKPTLGTPYSVETLAASPNSINITFAEVIGASGYEVLRATSKTGIYNVITTTEDSSFTDTGLITGVNYYYKVRAYTKVGTTKVYGNYSTVVNVKPV